jgi:uncharacterized membrane protein YagU involved in acid resistance
MAQRHLLLDLALGAAAGAVATWVMDEVTTALYEREPKKVQKRENAARGQKTAYEIAAEKAASVAGRKLTRKEGKAVGTAIHWSLGVSAGAVYGVLRNRIPALGLGSGLAYGTAFWLAMDEAALTLLGLTPPPQEFPWQTHLRGLAGHLALGAVVEAAFDAVDVATER